MDAGHPEGRAPETLPAPARAAAARKPRQPGDTLWGWITGTGTPTNPFVTGLADNQNGQDET